MKKIISFSLALLLCVVAFAQKPTIKFENTNHDFGEIQEKEGSVTHNFEFTNTGSVPLVISNVTASCGCTTPEWTRKPIRPNEKGNISVTFNPANRPGTFNKTISVISNAAVPQVTLRITGKVLQRPKTIEETYPVVMDSLRLVNSHVPFAQMTQFSQKTETLEVINLSSIDLKPSFFNVPQHIKIASQPAIIKAGEKGQFVVSYDASQKNDWGYVTDRIWVSFDGTRQFKNQITISASIEEDFSEVDPDEAPQFKVNEISHDFGEIAQTEKVETDFVVTNEGKQNLIIRKVKASCGCTAVAPEKTVLAKGESTKIHVTFDPRGKSGRQSKTITVITNDPKKSNVLLRITSTIMVAGAELKK